MYGPVSITHEMKAVMDTWHVDIESELNQREPRYNIAPTMKAPVIHQREDKTLVEAMRWGLVPGWAKDLKIGASAINARVETVATKPMFRTALKKRRCLVPASGYFEWRVEDGAKQPYYIRQPQGELLMFAGLWEGWKPPDAEEWLHTYTIITGEPGKVSGDIHDRQPVILQPDSWADWLDADGDPVALLADVREAELSYYAVPKAVGSPKNQGAELVRPVPQDA
jgi:putative SOS response-associated peptidase YedK